MVAEADVGHSQSPSAIGQMPAALVSQAVEQKNPSRSPKEEKGLKGWSGDRLHPGKHSQGKFFHLNLFLTFVTQVRNHLDAESARQPGEPGSSKRRNRWRRLFSPSTFLEIVKKELGLHAFR